MSKPNDGWSNPPPDFDYVLFDRTDPTQNVRRFYLVGWLPTLFDDGAVVLVWGRKGSSQRVRVLLFGSLEEAWPAVRAVIRARLRHGYRITRDGVDADG